MLPLKYDKERGGVYEFKEYNCCELYQIIMVGAPKGLITLRFLCEYLLLVLRCIIDCTSNLHSIVSDGLLHIK
jgi:hypothetical protein